MKKKILLASITLVAVSFGIVGLSAFEAHIINVTAEIENALSVNPEDINFGTVFPQEQLDRNLTISLSQSFQDEERVDDVEYVIRQKPKCGIPEPGTGPDTSSPQLYSSYMQATDGPNGTFECPDGSIMLPLLCPYLSKHKVDTGETIDGPDIDAFHGPIENWLMADTLANQVKGRLAKSLSDFEDTWKIDLKVPCFGGYCAQDWDDYVRKINPEVNPSQYIQPIEREHDLFGCDLWVEVTGISYGGELSCNESPDVMLVLDRSGSIGSDMPTLKNAAIAFVNALNPSTLGAHMGQSSFASAGSLNTHLTDATSTIIANINALASSGATDLEAGITLASAELGGGDGHDRNDATSPDYMVIITDGQPNVPNQAQGEADGLAAATSAKNAGTTIYVVGVGSQVNPAYLQQIASSPAHYFSAANFGDLQAILETLVTCNN